ncbi:TPA: hypothetical protein ACG1RV_004532 [Salmonella enterica subsp. enterica serovar Derby]|uniref:Eaa protein n=2 Tax=Salmonella enterica TaxID=28901 RepID=A0A721G946_SALER|nr:MULTISPECIES: hypothetical protein [Salmonella]EAA7874338.1 hypothetical protein [Salmonella enterica subsp. enterica serovar Lexington]EAV6552694.1 hypothetical protein [Salmonella enterica]EBN0301437.1 hypothetical protein [Salmonella enterica subsp. enterica serovar Newport]EBS0356666.1 hypothetical protein [Salmonella enterica subsp. enterica serovar Java]EBU6580156.1 hypothetical protein [Salmonella enterica subsp. enterica serovar Agona]ECG5366048.1 hypothetical protein [Salmonella e
MTTITKERIELFIKNPLENGLTRGEQMELARIALASLEVAPVGEVSEKRHGLVMDGTVDLGGKSTYRIIKGEKAMKRLPLGTKFYIAPPVPVVPPEKWVNPDINYAEENGFAEGWNACRAAMLQGGQPVSNRDELSSPVIPDGYALVPIVPTEYMVINGFESEPDPHFSDEKVWAEYEALSGCRRAARRAELCWAAMIKAAPKQEGNNG